MNQSRIDKASQLVNDYVACWGTRPQGGIYEDNDLGCEHLQIFKNDLAIEEFTQDELLELCAHLTKSLQGQINRDHKLLWSWTAFLSSGSDVPTSIDRDWRDAFRALVNLMLVGRTVVRVGAGHPRKRSSEMNVHAEWVPTDKHIVAGPLAFAVMEGLLRRKCSAWVTKDGTVVTAFTVTTRNCTKKFEKNKLNRVGMAFRLLEEHVIPNRGRLSPHLPALRVAFDRLFPGPEDTFDMLDTWRNDLVHGSEYWQNRSAALLNLICFLWLDELTPAEFDGISASVKASLRQRQTFGDDRTRAPWDIFPPDVTTTMVLASAESEGPG